MPRDGSNVYSVPGGTDGVPDQPVYSTPYNAFVHDVEKDLNIPRPILAGGTGAINARDAMIALNGEISNQVVTNYDSYPWVPGSFYSAAGATSAPTADVGYAGIYYEQTAAYGVIEARNLSSGVVYVRRKSAGVWGAWAAQVGPLSDIDAALALKVSKAGDVMGGALRISYTSETRDGGITFGDGSRYLYLDGHTTPAAPAFSMNAPLSIGGRLTSSDIRTGALYNDGNIYVGYGAAKGGTIYFGTDGAQYIQHNGSARFYAPGEMDHGNNAIFASQLIASSGVIRFSREGAGEVSGGKYLYFDGTNYTLTPGSLSVNGIVTPNLTMPYGATVLINQLAGSLHQATGGSVTIKSHASAGYDPFITYWRDGGAFAANMGLMDNNRFGFGGWSHGYPNKYMFWSEADFGSPVIQTRLVYIGDTDHGYNSPLNEPSVGAVCTGLSGPSVYNAFTGRYRALQVRTPSGYYGTETG